MFALFSSFPLCFIFCLLSWPLYASYSCQQISTGILTGCAGLLQTSALKPSRSELPWENSNMRNQTHLKLWGRLVGRKKKSAFFCRMFCHSIGRQGFLYRKIHFQVFWQNTEILYRKQMVCIEILYKWEPSLPLKGSVNSPQIWDAKLEVG